MWTFVILSFGVVFSLYGLRKSLQERKHPRKKQPRRNDRVFSESSSDDEMTEEQMIAEDYYFYEGKN